MLSERQLEGLLQVFEARYSDIADEYLRRMGEHIRDIGTLHPSDVHRLTEMKRMRANTRDIRQKIARAAGLTLKDLDRVFRSVAASNERFARAWFGSNQTAPVRGSGRLERIIKAQLRQTAQTMQNLSNTTVVTEAYRKAVDRGISAVTAGVEDYGSAIRRALTEAGNEGLRVRYESGHTRRLDTAVRQNVLDGVRQLNQDTLTQLGKEFGADGVEIDAHMLCAEDHLPYQGGQFSNEEFQEIQDSLQRPFGEWNCRHTWHPILIGISRPAYTDDQLAEMRAYSTEEIEIDGTTRTRYEWSQQLRRLETQVRQTKDTATLAKAAGDATLRRQCQQTLESLQRQYERTADAAGLTADWSRMNVRGFEDAKNVKGIKTLTGSVDHGRMKVSTGGRRNETPLTSSQKEECKRIAIEYGMPVERIVFSDNMFTGYMPAGDRLYIGTDVYPSGNFDKANYMISHRGTLAHELIGHRNAHLLDRTQSIEYLEEAQASLRAAQLAKGLSDDERRILMQDAAERLPDGITLDKIIDLLFLGE